MIECTVIIKKGGNNYSAYAPDLPGCITTGPTVEKTLDNMREAIELHLEGMREDGDPIPAPTSVAATVLVGGALSLVLVPERIKIAAAVERAGAELRRSQFLHDLV